MLVALRWVLHISIQSKVQNILCDITALLLFVYMCLNGHCVCFGPHKFSKMSSTLKLPHLELCNQIKCSFSVSLPYHWKLDRYNR